jgi:hypothetical protein
MTGRTAVRSRRRRAGFFIALLGIAIAGAATLSPPAGAAVGFTAIASASGGRFTVSAENFPLHNTPIDGATPIAQATLDSVGAGASFASVLYPGEVPLSVPGLAGGAAGVPPVAPPYPLIAKADIQNPKSDASGPGYTMSAATSAAESTATATAGPSHDYQASASVKAADDGTVVVASDSVSSGFTVGPLKLGAVRAHAKVVRRADGTLERSSGIEVSSADVLGVPTKLPILPGSPIEQTLTNAGIRLDYLPAEQTPTGVVSAGVRLTFERETGQSISKVRSTLTIGQASVAILSAKPGDVAPSPVLGPTDQAGAAPVAPAVAPVPQTPSGAVPTVVPAVNRVAAPARALPAQAVQGDTAAFTQRVRAGRWYLALVGAALATGGVVLLISEYGVKLRWT